MKERNLQMIYRMCLDVLNEEKDERLYTPLQAQTIVTLKHLTHLFEAAGLKPAAPADIIDRNDYAAVKLWSEYDVHTKAKELGFMSDDSSMKKVISSGMLDALEECTDHDWEIIAEAVRTCTKYDYETFREKIRKYLEQEFHVPVTVQTVLKNNGYEKEGLIAHTESRCCPTIYIEEFYKSYDKGTSSFDEVRTSIADMVRNSTIPDACKKIVDNLFDFDTIKNKIIFTVINRKQNLQLLETIPYTEFLDLAIIYRIVVKEDHTGIQFITIKHNLMEKWGITHAQLHETALRNTPVLMKPKIMNMNELPMFPKTDIPMYAISNEQGRFGASSVLYQGVLGNVAKILCDDLLLIPSSVDEFLVLPESCGLAGEAAFMITAVNNDESAILPEQILSDHAYIYRRRTGQIEML